MIKRYDDETVQAYYEQAQTLADTMAPFFNEIMVEKVADERCSFNVVATAGDVNFRVSKDYKGYIDITLYKYERFNKLSSSKRAEIYTKHSNTLNRMKVPTQKKVTELVNAVIAERDEMQRLQKQYTESQRMFLCDIEALKLPVQYQHNHEYYTDENGEYKQRKTDVSAGEIERNGIVYRFEFHRDGYIKQDIELYYGVKDTMENFIALSDNEYKA